MNRHVPPPPAIEMLVLFVMDTSLAGISNVRMAAAMCGILDVQRISSHDEVFDVFRTAPRESVLLVCLKEPPDADLALCRAIRDRTSSPRPFLPMIAIAQSATRDHVRMARDAGIDEFLACPFTPKAFRARIEAIAFQRRGFVDVPGYFGPDRRRGAIAEMLGANRRATPTRLIDPLTEQTYIG